MNAKKIVMGLLGVLVFSSVTMASFIPYPNAGTVNATTYTFTAAGGDVMAYFYGSDASYDSQISLLVNNLTTGTHGYGLPNHGTPVGTAFNMGTASSGDILEFVLYVSTTGDHWNSNPADNSDGMNHIYSTSFDGNTQIPVSGTYIGYEDKPASDPSNDYDYNDHQFVFTGVSKKVPDGGMTCFLLGLGLAAVGLIKRKLA